VRSTTANVSNTSCSFGVVLKTSREADLGFSPLPPVADRHTCHLFRSLMQPFGLSCGEVSLDRSDRLVGPQMHVGRLPAHRVQEMGLISFFRQCGQFNARAVGGEPSYKPATLYPYKRILAPNSLGQYRLIEDGGGSIVRSRPHRG